MSAGGSIAAPASQGRHSSLAARFTMFPEKLNRWLLSWAGAVCLALAPTTPGQAAENEPSPKPRILLVEDKSALREFEVDAVKVADMVAEGLKRLTAKPSAAAALLTLVSPADTVGIKVNSVPGSIGGTRKPVVDAVVRGLLEARLAPDRIIIWDRSLASLKAAGYGALAKRHGVRLAGSRDAGWDESVTYESPIIGTLVSGDLGFERGGENASRKSHLSRLLTGEMTRIISICPLLNHNQAGVSGHLVGLVDGSMDNSRRFGTNASVLAVAVPEILALEDAAQRRHLGDRLVLGITDALFCQYLGQNQCLLHYTAALGQLRFSTDPVALDVFSIEELKRQRELFEADYSPPDSALYRNAALIQLGESDPARREVVEIFR
ncbi:MAG: hypothetical protein QF721_06025 [Verrucomicrobiota bacterium]|nr:hypothetical protein [Verrucomicrobiota bacterium]MDP7048987.1 hypothetical protein [Verrucomicrobiota bacterium]